MVHLLLDLRWHRVRQSSIFTLLNPHPTLHLCKSYRQELSSALP